MADLTPVQQGKFLQTEINRYVKVTGLAPLSVDGSIGPKTAQATKLVLAKIVEIATEEGDAAGGTWGDFRQFASGYSGSVDASAPATVSKQAWALADLFKKFGDLYISQYGDRYGKYVILKDTWVTPTATSTGTYTPRPVPQATPVQPVATQASRAPIAASVNFLGVRLPRWALYVGGGALAFAVVGLIATRKKPSKPVNGVRRYVHIAPPVTARVTAVSSDGAKWGWPGERVIRYQADDGSWAWVPGTEKVGDTIKL